MAGRVRLAAVVGDGGAFGTYGWVDFSCDLCGIFFTQLRMRPAYQMALVQVPAEARKVVKAANKR